MNNPHQNARTTIHRRDLIVDRHRQGRPMAVIAAELGIPARTVYKWLRRFRRGGRGIFDTNMCK